MRNVSDESCGENQNALFVFSIFFSKNCAVYEIMTKIIVEPGRLHMTIWCMNTAYWVPKATSIRSECVKLTALPLQHRLHERPSMSRSTCVACLYSDIRMRFLEGSNLLGRGSVLVGKRLPALRSTVKLKSPSAGLFNPLK